MSYWWLSFADGDLPRGEQFLGVAVVRGDEMDEAVSRAHALGVNPGGQVLGVELPEDALELIPKRFRNRLLDAKQASRLASLLDDRLRD